MLTVLSTTTHKHIDTSLPAVKFKQFRFDASNLGSIKQLARDVLFWSGGRLDILVNNAGVSQVVLLTGDDAEYEKVWEQTLSVNVTAQQRLTRALLPALMKSGGISFTLPLTVLHILITYA